MLDQETRSGAFMGGAQASSYNGSAGPSVPRPFRPQSVFDKAQVIRNANGRSAADQSRTLVNGTPQSVNGLSQDTFTDKAWIGQPYRTYGG